MDKIVQSRQSALKSIQMAKYLLNTTYPILKEPKTLLSISDHIFNSFMSSVSMLLLAERNKKNIPPFHETTESKINSFKQNLVRKYRFEDYLNTIEAINNLSKHHISSAIEFSRDRKFVLCDSQFKDIKTVSERDVRSFIEKASEFNEKVSSVVSNE